MRAEHVQAARCTRTAPSRWGRRLPERASRVQPRNVSYAVRQSGAGGEVLVRLLRLSGPPRAVDDVAGRYREQLHAVGSDVLELSRLIERARGELETLTLERRPSRGMGMDAAVAVSSSADRQIGRFTVIRVLTIVAAAVALAVTAQPATAKTKNSTLTMYTTDGTATAKYYLETAWPNSEIERRSAPHRLPSRPKAAEITLTRG